MTAIECYGRSSSSDHSENESDLATTSSNQAINIEYDSSTGCGNSTVSLISVLKAPDMSELSRKQKVVKNQPIGKKRAHSNCQSNP